MGNRSVVPNKTTLPWNSDGLFEPTQSVTLTERPSNRVIVAVRPFFLESNQILKELLPFRNGTIGISEHVHSNPARVRRAELDINKEGLFLSRVEQLAVQCLPNVKTTTMSIQQASL